MFNDALAIWMVEFIDISDSTGADVVLFLVVAALPITSPSSVSVALAANRYATHPCTFT